jgi:hypothetical protein
VRCNHGASLDAWITGAAEHFGHDAFTKDSCIRESRQLKDDLVADRYVLGVGIPQKHRLTWCAAIWIDKPRMSFATDRPDKGRSVTLDHLGDATCFATRPPITARGDGCNDGITIECVGRRALGDEQVSLAKRDVWHDKPETATIGAVRPSDLPAHLWEPQFAIGARLEAALFNHRVDGRIKVRVVDFLDGHLI